MTIRSEEFKEEALELGKNLIGLWKILDEGFGSTLDKNKISSWEIDSEFSSKYSRAFWRFVHREEEDFNPIVEQLRSFAHEWKIRPSFFWGQKKKELKRIVKTYEAWDQGLNLVMDLWDVPEAQWLFDLGEEDFLKAISGLPEKRELLTWLEKLKKNSTFGLEPYAPELANSLTEELKNIFDFRTEVIRMPDFEKLLRGPEKISEKQDNNFGRVRYFRGEEKS